jgi:hypothetical protein
MNLKFPLAGAALLGLAMLALSGCGQSKVKVTGKVLKNGQPLGVPTDTLVTVNFSPEDTTKGQNYPASYQYDSSTFQVELPPGKYHVSCSVVDKNKERLSISPEQAKKSFEFTKPEEQLDIEIAVK